MIINWSRPINKFLKLINNSPSLNRGNHDRDGAWLSDLNQERCLKFYSFSPQF